MVSTVYSALCLCFFSFLFKNVETILSSSCGHIWPVGWGVLNPVNAIPHTRTQEEAARGEDIEVAYPGRDVP